MTHSRHHCQATPSFARDALFTPFQECVVIGFRMVSVASRIVVIPAATETGTIA
jgi:hypothetical protein